MGCYQASNEQLKIPQVTGGLMNYIREVNTTLFHRIAYNQLEDSGSDLQGLLS